MSEYILPTPTDISDLDFFQSVERLLQLAESARPDIDWRSKAAMERLLFEGMSTLTDKLTVLVNNRGRENYISTAYQRLSLFRLVKGISYRPATFKAATTMETFTVTSGPLAAPVVIPKGSTVRTRDKDAPVIYQLLSNVTIPPGPEPQQARGLVENSQTYSMTFQSDAKAGMTIRLPIAPYLSGSVTVSTPQGEWTEVRNFIRSNGNSLHFWTESDAADRGIIHFGDNQLGAIPTGLLTITYRYGGGRGGNTAPNTVTVLDGSFTDNQGNPVQIAVTNTSRIDNGDDRESTPKIKMMAPLSIRTPRCCVAREDYETTATDVPGVARAMLLTRNQDVAVQENTGLLFVVPKGGGIASDELLADVAKRYSDEVTVGVLDNPVQVAGDRPKTVTFQLRVRAAVYRYIDVTARIYLRQGYDPAIVRQNVQAALQELFAVEVDARTIDPRLPPGLVPNPRIDFGARLLDADGQPTDRLAYSDVYDAVHDAAGVLKIGDAVGDFLLNGAQTDAVIGRPEFPALGTVVLINAKTNQAI